MKAFAVIVGMILTIVLYVGILLCGSYFFPAAEDTGSHDLSLKGIYFAIFIYIPLVFTLGSISTGIIIEPEMTEEQSYRSLILYSPGIYFVIPVILFGIATESMPEAFRERLWCCLMPFVLLLLWPAASWAGVVLGCKIRAKISGDEN